MGAAVAKQFLSDGFSGVVLLDRNAEGLKRQASMLSHLGAVEVLPADLRNDDTAEKAVGLCIEKFGRIDVVVNAAGNTERCGIADTTPEAFHRLFDVNVKAPLQIMQQATKHMVAAKSGVIINMASMLAYGGPPSIGTYAASKAALVALSKNAANTFKRQGVRVFCINLGWVLSEGEHEMQTKFHGLPENWHEEIGARMPAGRLIKPEDVAGLCAYLVSPSAQMMNGAVIDYEQMPMGVYDVHPALRVD
ncbi:MAG: SDR family oxidoreductase [Alphaproteobacteria bacterium]|nr:SDR family oxidoreductase [Alphaproteobacteria bacterium]